MIITNEMIKADLVNYANKNNKISRDIWEGKLIKIVNGLYEKPFYASLFTCG